MQSKSLSSKVHAHVYLVFSNATDARIRYSKFLGIFDWYRPDLNFQSWIKIPDKRILSSQANLLAAKTRKITDTLAKNEREGERRH